MHYIYSSHTRQHKYIKLKQRKKCKKKKFLENKIMFVGITKKMTTITVFIILTKML